MIQEVLPVTRYYDPLRRLTVTPLVAEFGVMGRTIRLECNSDPIFNSLLAVFGCRRTESSRRPDFCWRIVGEKNLADFSGWPEMAAFSDEGIRYVNLGKQSFFAVDIASHKAVAFIPETLTCDPAGFISVFAATLFDMTASGLGLVPISSACVSLLGKAVLILGPPRSGKTTSTYLAGKLGLEFHSDQAAYLDLLVNGLRVWGQFWPAAFREESLAHLPELALTEHSFRYAHLNYFCFGPQRTCGDLSCSVTPVATVFLERQAAQVPHLIALPPAQKEARLKNCFAFKEDQRFAPVRRKVLRLLTQLPGYRLPYGDDPAVAATFFRSILSVHNSLELAR